MISLPPFFALSGLLPFVNIIFIIFSIQFFCSSYHSLFFFLVLFTINIVILPGFYIWLLRFFLISGCRLMIILDLFIFIFWFKIWSENIVAIFCSSHKHFSIIGMETKFFNIVLSLMQEHKLWWNIFRSWWRLFFIYFDWEVPDS